MGSGRTPSWRPLVPESEGQVYLLLEDRYNIWGLKASVDALGAVTYTGARGADTSINRAAVAFDAVQGRSKDRSVYGVLLF